MKLSFPISGQSLFPLPVKQPSPPPLPVQAPQADSGSGDMFLFCGHTDNTRRYMHSTPHPSRIGTVIYRDPTAEEQAARWNQLREQLAEEDRVMDRALQDDIARQVREARLAERKQDRDGFTREERTQFDAMRTRHQQTVLLQTIEANQKEDGWLPKVSFR